MNHFARAVLTDTSNLEAGDVISIGTPLDYRLIIAVIGNLIISVPENRWNRFVYRRVFRFAIRLFQA